MRVPLRETGSILVNAPRERVFEVLRRELAHQPNLTETPAERIESRGEKDLRTFVLRDEAGGTRLYHARATERVLRPGNGPRDELRAAVESELLRVQRLVRELP